MYVPVPEGRGPCRGKASPTAPILIPPLRGEIYHLQQQIVTCTEILFHEILMWWKYCAERMLIVKYSSLLDQIYH